MRYSVTIASDHYPHFAAARMPLLPPPAELHDLVSGHTQGLRASLFRMVLSTLEPLYHLATAFRNYRFDRNPSLSTQIGVPVISVGNLTVGGTGKTPVVLWIAQYLREKDLRVAIISRGYGAESSRNDEAMELEQRLPDVPHVQHADRVEGAKIAIDELETQVLLLDDAFQHRRIARDLDLVLIDALCPFGYGHLLPRGLLRESLRGLRRAQAVILTRSDLVSDKEKGQIKSQVLSVAPNTAWIEASHTPGRLIDATNACVEISHLAGATVAGFCGIGNPDGFRKTLEKCGAKIVTFRTFADHHAYTAEDVRELNAWAKQSGAELIICTQKDLVKLRIDSLANIPLFALQIDMKIHVGNELLQRQIDDAIAKREFDRS
jgi:tetraacyldisaccharide 4'-kinase